MTGSVILLIILFLLAPATPIHAAAPVPVPPDPAWLQGIWKIRISDRCLRSDDGTVENLTVTYYTPLKVKSEGVLEGDLYETLEQARQAAPAVSHGSFVMALSGFVSSIATERQVKIQASKTELLVGQCSEFASGCTVTFDKRFLRKLTSRISGTGTASCTVSSASTIYLGCTPTFTANWAEEAP